LEGPQALGRTGEENAMKHSLAAGLAAAAALGLAGTGVAAPAWAAVDPYPVSEGWHQIDQHRTLPAGSACKVAVQDDDTGHLRVLPVSKNRFFVDAGEDARATFTNLANGRKLTLDISGDVYVRVSKSGRTAHGTAFGSSYFQGKGIKGIVYADGVQKNRVTRLGTKNETQHLRILNGTKKDLCRLLGTTPVKGMNVPF
jgi:hypothetical protein